MANWIIEVFCVLASSKRTSLALIFGVAFFIVTNLLGYYMLSDFVLHGVAAGFTDVVKEKLAGRYDKAALVVMFSFWGLAYKFYEKDKNKYY